MPIEEIEGYAQFQRDTNEIVSQFPRVMAVAAMEIAVDWVNAAQAMANTAQQQAAASTLEINEEGEEGVTLRSVSPIFFGAEFGGQARPSTMQFPPHQGRRGYFLYPAKRMNEDRFNDIWDKGVEAAMKEWDRRG